MTILPFAIVLLIALVPFVAIVTGMNGRRSRRRALVVTVPAHRPRQPSTPNAGPYRAPSERRVQADTPAARRETLHFHTHPESDTLLREVRSARHSFESQFPQSRR